MEMFAEAAKRKLRFPSPVGELTAEQLWDLPLVSKPSMKNALDLNSTAIAISRQLKDASEENFVNVRPNPHAKLSELRLEIVKFVIAEKEAEAKKAQDAILRADKRRKILDALEAQENKALTEASREDLLKQLSEVDSEAA